MQEHSTQWLSDEIQFLLTQIERNRYNSYELMVKFSSILKEADNRHYNDCVDFAKNCLKHANSKSDIEDIDFKQIYHETFDLIGYKKRFNAMKKLLQTKIIHLGLSERTKNCLLGGDVEILGDLVSLEEKRLLRFRNLGETSLEEIKDKIMQKYDLSFGMDVLRYNIW